MGISIPVVGALRMHGLVLTLLLPLACHAVETTLHGLSSSNPYDVFHESNYEDRPEATVKQARRNKLLSHISSAEKQMGHAEAQTQRAKKLPAPDPLNTESTFEDRFRQGRTRALAANTDAATDTFNEEV